MSIYKKNENGAMIGFQSPYKKRLIQIAKMANYQPIASIPNIKNDFNFTYAKDGHLKRKPKVEQESEFTPQYSPFKSQQRSAHVLTRLPKIDSKLGKIQNHPTNTSQPNEQFLTVDTRLQIEEYLKNSRSKVLNSPRQVNHNKNNKKIRQRYSANKQVTEDDEQQEQQFSSNDTPGPGYYSVCDTSTFNSSKRGLTDFSFGSRQSRFKQQKLQKITKKSPLKNPQNQQKLQKPLQNVRRRKKLIPFLSCSIKQDHLFSKQKLPGPQDYFPRNGIQQQLIRKIQRNFKGSFGVGEQRFKSDDKFPNIAPGIYNLKQPGYINQDPGSYYFISQKKRFE